MPIMVMNDSPMEAMQAAQNVSRQRQMEWALNQLLRQQQQQFAVDSEQRRRFESNRAYGLQRDQVEFQQEQQGLANQFRARDQQLDAARVQQLGGYRSGSLDLRALGEQGKMERAGMTDARMRELAQERLQAQKDLLERKLLDGTASREDEQQHRLLLEEMRQSGMEDRQSDRQGWQEEQNRLNREAAEQRERTRQEQYSQREATRQAARERLALQTQANSEQDRQLRMHQASLRVRLANLEGLQRQAEAYTRGYQPVPEPLEEQLRHAEAEVRDATAQFDNFRESSQAIGGSSLEEAYNRLPPGAIYIGPDGQRRRKQ